MSDALGWYDKVKREKLPQLEFEKDKPRLFTILQVRTPPGAHGKVFALLEGESDSKMCAWSLSTDAKEKLHELQEKEGIKDEDLEGNELMVTYRGPLPKYPQDEPKSKKPIKHIWEIILPPSGETKTEPPKTEEPKTGLSGKNKDVAKWLKDKMTPKEKEEKDE